MDNSSTFDSKPDIKFLFVFENDETFLVVFEIRQISVYFDGLNTEMLKNGKNLNNNKN